MKFLSYEKMYKNGVDICLMDDVDLFLYNIEN